MLDEYYVIVFPDSDRAFCHDDLLSIHPSLKDCIMQSGSYSKYLVYGPVFITEDSTVYFEKKEKAIELIKKFEKCVGKHIKVPRIQLLFIVRNKAIDLEEWTNGKLYSVPTNQWK